MSQVDNSQVKKDEFKRSIVGTIIFVFIGLLIMFFPILSVILILGLLFGSVTYQAVWSFVFTIVSIVGISIVTILTFWSIFKPLSERVRKFAFTWVIVMLVWSIISMLLMIFLLQEGFSFSFVSLVILPYLGISFYLGYEHKAARYIMPFYKEVSGSNDVHNSV